MGCSASAPADNIASTSAITVNASDQPEAGLSKPSSVLKTSDSSPRKGNSGGIKFEDDQKDSKKEKVSVCVSVSVYTYCTSGCGKVFRACVCMYDVEGVN